MQPIRIVTGAAIVVILAVILPVPNGAIAQNNAQPGKPLALLAGLTPPHEEKTAAHANPVHKAVAKSARKQAAKMASIVAAKQLSDAPPAPSTLPENKWSAPEGAAPANVVAEPSAAPAMATTDDPAPGALVVNGQTVQIEPADQINEIDLAAADQDAEASAAMPADRADVNDTTAPLVAVTAREAASPVASLVSSSVGSASWIAQVLAALGGAIAAGSVAWFLIGSGPQRTYG